MRRLRKKTKKPRSPWNSALIEEEEKILSQYGLRRKREILKARAILRDFRRRARQATAERDEEAGKVLLEKLAKLGLLKEAKEMDDVLALSVNDILERRLQTIVFKKGHAKTPRQARQMITHGLVLINGVKASYPSYLVPAEEEARIEVLKPKPKKPKASKPVEKEEAPKEEKAEAPAEEPKEEPPKEEPKPEEKSEEAKPEEPKKGSEVPQGGKALEKEESK